jgi:hypothetical protein
MMMMMKTRRNRDGKGASLAANVKEIAYDVGEPAFWGSCDAGREVGTAEYRMPEILWCGIEEAATVIHSWTGEALDVYVSAITI